MILRAILLAITFGFLNAGTFTNPIVDFGPDPWVIQHDGYYYYCRSVGVIEVFKSKKLQDIGRGVRKVVFIPPANTSYSKEIWAPELHHIRGKWYIYFAADDGRNENHRMYVLESTSPQGEYVFKGKITDKTDKWAIDGTVLQLKGKLYFIWSGWEKDHDNKQNLYIAKMSNPWTIEGDRVLISTPTEPWEKNSIPFTPGGINEGPEALVKGNKVYIVYSASGAWNDDYCLGWLVCDNPDNVMSPRCWKKTGPVFTKAEGAYGPGHASFTKSPDQKEDWILYHACLKSGGGFAGRSARIQKFKFVNRDVPAFGRPAKPHIPMPEPSGS
eukprot:TRINITY_DN8471_c0_g1_i3.p1 TRINITY_DN8471_c0_g1~~TRINITY_DN8471_c0_g1_i3.p1  ORF type:complete len:328 (+),score=44.32 TRINITY_DN8471_c0_g1_i3:36-1019(+)